MPNEGMIAMPLVGLHERHLRIEQVRDADGLHVDYPSGW
jgi:hypothetical protein